MADFVDVPIRAATTSRLNIWQPNPQAGGIYTFGRESFTYDGKKWWRHKQVREPKPEFMYFIAFFEETLPSGLNFIMLRCPGKNNWHKRIVPAMKRILKKILGHKLSYYYVDSLDQETFNKGQTKLGPALRFDYKDKDFIPYQ